MQKMLIAASLYIGLAWQASAQMLEQPPAYQPPSWPQQPSYQQPAYQPPSYPQPAYQGAPPAPYQQPAATYATPASAATQPFCQPYADHFNIGHETRITRGTACLRPDGSWELHPQQLGMRYITNGSELIFIPLHPFATGMGYYHHNHLD